MTFIKHTKEICGKIFTNLLDRRKSYDRRILQRWIMVSIILKNKVEMFFGETIRDIFDSTIFISILTCLSNETWRKNSVGMDRVESWKRQKRCLPNVGCCGYGSNKRRG